MVPSVAKEWIGAVMPTGATRSIAENGWTAAGVPGAAAVIFADQPKKAK